MKWMNIVKEKQTHRYIKKKKKKKKPDWWLPVGRGRVDDWELQTSIYKMDRLNDVL